MAASPYFITAQVALVAASAALLRIDWTDKSKQYQPQRTASSSSKPLTSPAARVNPALDKSTDSAKSLAIQNDPPAATVPALGEHGVDPALGTDSILSGPPETTPFTDDILTESASSMAGYRITADSATNFDLSSHTVVFSGRVSLSSSRFDLTSSRLVVHMDPKKNELKKLVATGDVKVKLNAASQDQSYRGNSYEATYEPADGSIVLSGWPQITGNGREHRAAERSTRMVLFTEKPRLVTQGRASTRIIGTNNTEPTGSKAPMAVPVR
jgi:lipopolysaccharide transport protein LptA